MSINIIFHKLTGGLALVFASVLLFTMTAMDVRADNSSNTPPADNAFKTVEWIDLMPKEDLEALSNPPDYINEIEDGAFEDQIDNQLQNTLDTSPLETIPLETTDLDSTAIDTIAEDRYQQALVSTSVIPELDGKPIRIPGFIVPLEFNDDQTITQFFLVPYFGACIHMPPPPPNQIIFVNYPKGLKLDALYDPFWISGVLKTTLQENDMATSAYAMNMKKFEIYRD